MQFKFYQHVEIGGHKFPRGAHSVPPAIQQDAYFKACMVSGWIVSLQPKKLEQAAAPAVKESKPASLEAVDSVESEGLDAAQESLEEPVKEEKKSKKKSKKE